MLCLKCIPAFCWARAELEQQLQEVQPEQEPMDSTAAVPHPFTAMSLQPWAAAVWSSDGKQRPKMNQDWIAEGNTVCLKPALVAQWHRDVPGPPGWAWQGQPQPSVPHDIFFPQEKPLPPLHGLGVSWHQAQAALLLLTMLHSLGMYLLTAQELEGPRAIRVFNISVTCADKRTSKSLRASPPAAMPQDASGQAQ